MIREFILPNGPAYGFSKTGNCVNEAAQCAESVNVLFGQEEASGLLYAWYQPRLNATIVLIDPTCEEFAHHMQQCRGWEKM